MNTAKPKQKNIEQPDPLRRLYTRYDKTITIQHFKVYIDILMMDGGEETMTLPWRFLTNYIEYSGTQYGKG